MNETSTSPMAEQVHELEDFSSGMLKPKNPGAFSNPNVRSKESTWDGNSTSNGQRKHANYGIIDTDTQTYRESTSPAI